jgi:opacity protein-like surface antigen
MVRKIGAAVLTAVFMWTLSAPAAMARVPTANEDGGYGGGGLGCKKPCP